MTLPSAPKADALAFNKGKVAALNATSAFLGPDAVFFSATDGLVKHSRNPGERDATLAQTLGRLQPVVAAFPRRCNNAWANSHRLGRPNTSLAPGERQIAIAYL